MVLNLYDKNSILSVLQKVFDLSEATVNYVVEHLDEDISYVTTFCKETGIKLDVEYLPKEFQLVGKIVSTSIDNNASIKTKGVLPVDVLLNTESPISSFLKKRGISINVSRNEFLFNGVTYNIPADIEKCDWCSLGNEECKFLNSRYKSMYCPYLEAVSNLSYRLYAHKSEIEMFLYSSKKNMRKYSRVSEFPEILTTINDFCNDFFHVQLELGEDWKKLKPETYILTFKVNYSDLSYKDEFVNSDLDGSDLLWDYQDCCNEYYDIPEVAPDCFWDNVWFIKTCMGLLDANVSDNKEICAGLKHNIIIAANDISIEEI